MQICELDLRGWTVATECANSAYATTAAAAVAAGAEVWAFGRDSPWATFAESAKDVIMLSEILGARTDRLNLVQQKADIPFERVDLVTNSGHLRPLDAPIITRLPSNAIIALMFEAWEIRSGDIDLQQATNCGIPIVAVDEHHTACGAFEFVGALAVSEAMRQNWSVGNADVAIISDNAFLEPIARAFTALDARITAIDPNERSPSPRCDVAVCDKTTILERDGPRFDLCVLATTPANVVGFKGAPHVEQELAELIIATGAYGCIQLWGDVDRALAEGEGVVFAPREAPSPGHQAIPMNAAGHEATVRLQVGGLAAAVHGRSICDGASVPDRLSGLVQWA